MVLLMRMCSSYFLFKAFISERRIYLPTKNLTHFFTDYIAKELTTEEENIYTSIK